MVCEEDRPDCSTNPDPATLKPETDRAGHAGGISLDQFWARLDPLDT